MKKSSALCLLQLMLCIYCLLSALFFCYHTYYQDDCKNNSGFFNFCNFCGRDTVLAGIMGSEQPNGNDGGIVEIKPV
jgi:hypothetical protein